MIAYNQGHSPLMRLRALIDHLKQAFGDPPHWDKGLTLPAGIMT
ncbi:hypothetical protein [Sphingomonas sp.]|nr:hypothetical protein [Sphingomonas sp.]